MKSNFPYRAITVICGGMAVVFWSELSTPSARGGAFLRAKDQNNPRLVMTPKGYDGALGSPMTIELSVCIDSTSPFLDEMEPPLRRAIATFNQRLPATGQFMPDAIGSFPRLRMDFESVALHELGHCGGGLAHTNQVIFPVATDWTTSTPGPDGTLDLFPGPDNAKGSPDDERNDDVNYHWFNKALNNPFVLFEPVGECSTSPSCTYSVLASDYPDGHTFAANANDDLSIEPEYNLPITQAVMYSVTIVNATARRLTPDDVATLLLSSAGNDGQAGTGDDFELRLVYVGRQAPTTCDIPVKFVPDIDGAIARCNADAQPVPANLDNNRWRLTTMAIEFDLEIGDTVEWFFGPSDVIFADGFESGNTQNWDATVPQNQG